ncbi:MAG: hypothetical protein K4304_07275 [Propionicimonas sp.]
MKSESRVLEAFGNLGLIGLVGLLLTVVWGLTADSGVNLLLLTGALFLTLIGFIAWVGILVANRVAIRQELILERLAELQRVSSE